MDIPTGNMMNHPISVDRVPDYAAFKEELRKIYKDCSNYDICKVDNLYIVTARTKICGNPIGRLENLGIVKTFEGELKDRPKDVPTCQYVSTTTEPEPPVMRSQGTQTPERRSSVSDWLNTATAGSDVGSFVTGRCETIYSDSDSGAKTTAESSQALVRLQPGAGQAGAGPGPSTSSTQTPASGSTALIRRDSSTEIVKRGTR